MNKEYEDLKELIFPEGKLFPKVAVSKEEFAHSVRKIFTEMGDILIKKNQMYGNSSMDLGLIGIYIHQHDKVMRLRSILERASSGEKMHFEGIEDTLRDMIGYSVLGLTVYNALMESLPVNGEKSCPHGLPPMNPPESRPTTSFEAQFIREQAMGAQMKESHDSLPVKEEDLPPAELTLDQLFSRVIRSYFLNSNPVTFVQTMTHAFQDITNESKTGKVFVQEVNRILGFLGIS